MPEIDAARDGDTPVRLLALRASFHAGMAVEYVAGVLLVAASVLIIMQVFFRYVLSSPLEWTEEAARYTAIWAGLLGATLGVRNNLHFRVLYLLNITSEEHQRTFKKVSDIVIVLLLCVIFWKGIEYTLDLGVAQLSPGLRISMVWLYSVVPATAALMLLFIFCEMIAGSVWPLVTDAQTTEAAIVEKIVLEAERAGGIAASQVDGSKGTSG